MKRRDFLGTLAMLPLSADAMKLPELTTLAAGKDTGDRLPVLFVGHGSPMNALEDNPFSRTWRKLGKSLPRPKAILAVSAHWLTRGTAVTAMERPPTIHDFGGFPQALFDVQYPAPGNPAYAEEIRKAVHPPAIAADQEWGLDHGTWSVLTHMYPEATIPVLQLSIDYPQPGKYHYELGRKLAGLRRKGFLIVASGNMVHNLRLIAFDKMDAPGYGFDWAHEINAVFKKHILDGNHAPLLDYAALGPAAKLAIPTPDHYYPLLYALGALEKGETPHLFNDQAVAGSLTMTSVSSAPIG
jgi:4,5-DOPA dioxygenase extradiol